MIDVTGIDLVKFVQKCYELSVPFGLGALHFTSQPLSDEEAEKLIAVTGRGDIAVSLDYVGGRACKMHVFKKGDRLEITDRWYDHTNEQLSQLLEHVGRKYVSERSHTPACGCDDCEAERKLKGKKSVIYKMWE